MSGRKLLRPPEKEEVSSSSSGEEEDEEGCDIEEERMAIIPEVFLLSVTFVVWIVACVGCNGTNCRIYFPDVFHLIPAIVHCRREMRFWILALIIALSATSSAPCYDVTKNEYYPFKLKTWVPMFTFLGIFVFVYAVYRGFYDQIKSVPRSRHVRLYEGFVLLQTLALVYSMIMGITLASGWIPSPLFLLMGTMSIYLTGDEFPRQPDDEITLVMSIFMLLGFIVAVVGITSSFSYPACLGDLRPSLSLVGIYTFSELGIILTAFTGFCLEAQRGCS